MSTPTKDEIEHDRYLHMCDLLQTIISLMRVLVAKVEGSGYFITKNRVPVDGDDE